MLAATREILSTDAKLQALFQRLPQAASRALFLDYDGTIAPSRADRHHAQPYPEVQALLDSIKNSSDTRLVIVTARRAREAAELLGVANVEIWGCHGWEHLHPDGTYELEASGQVLREMEEVNRLLSSEGLADFMECKPTGTALHWRGREAASGAAMTKVRRVWSVLRGSKNLILHTFDHGVEIRAAGRDKGFAVRKLLSEIPADAVIAYLGDDVTDEPAFSALRGRGVGVLVAERSRSSFAEASIPPTSGVISFLTKWASACGAI